MIMTMNRIKKVLSTLILAGCALLTSCEVEFSPNAEWQEIPVVYCVLDQDDSLSIVRLQKAYLGEGNLYHFSQIFDSINYAPEEFEVKLLEWEAQRGTYNLLSKKGNTPKRVLPFAYAELENKEEGAFSHPVQPVYVRATQGELDTSCVYELVVIRKATGDTLLTGETALIGNMPRSNYNYSGLIKPNVTTKFRFSNGANGTCLMQFYTYTRARKYQPMVRIFYGYSYKEEKGSLDIFFQNVRSSMNREAMEIALPKSTFLSQIKHHFEGDTNTKFLIDSVQLFVNAASEDLSAFMAANAPNGGINQVIYNYSNVKGGLGIVASRRTHIFYTLPSDADPKHDYVNDIKDLGVGF